MALGGFGLNPFADISQLGNNIGTAFGNQGPSNSQGTVHSAPHLPSNQIPVAQPQSINLNSPGLSQPTANQNTGSGNLSTAGGTAANTAANDQQIQSLQDQLNSTLAAQTGGLKSIDNSYDASVANNTLTHNRAQTGYDTQLNDTQNAEQGALGTVDTNARTLNNSLRRIIGLASGANSSAYQFAAPNAVARQASGQRENTLNTYGLNLRDVNTAKDQEATDFQTLLNNLAADKQAKIQGQNSSTDTELIKNYGSLADAAAAKAAVQGGDQNAARQPYLDQIAGKQAELARFLANPITAPIIKDLNPTTPSLRDYTVDKQAINATNQGGPAAYSPYSYFLNKKDQQVA